MATATSARKLRVGAPECQRGENLAEIFGRGMLDFMETDELLKALDQFHGGIPKRLLREAVEKKEQITPGLIASLVEVAEKPETFLENPERNLYYWAAYLLAHFETTEAHGPIINVLKLGDGKYLPLVEDLLDDVPLLLANTAGGKVEGIIESLHHGGSARLREGAADALGLLFLWDVIEAGTIIPEYKRALEELEEKDSWLGAIITVAAIDLNLRELGPTILAAYDRNVIDRDFAEMDYFAEWQHDPDFCGPPAYTHIPQSIEDIEEFFEEKLKEAEMVEGFDPGIGMDEGEEGDETILNVPYQAPPKVGRNDPCPCGSGKKYKKCCGA
jgi:hypothetical protein